MAREIRLDNRFVDNSNIRSPGIKINITKHFDRIECGSTIYYTGAKGKKTNTEADEAMWSVNLFQYGVGRTLPSGLAKTLTADYANLRPLRLPIKNNNTHS